MPQANVTMTVRQLNAHSSAIDIRGEVTAFAENSLMDAYTAAGAGSARNILLNFSELSYMNSSGIGLIVTLLIRAQRQNQQLLAYGLSDHYCQIFALTRLDEAIGIHASEADALAAAHPVGAR